MSEISDYFKREQAKRDRRVRSMIAKGHGPTQVAKALLVTRQRAQQIIKRLRNGKDSVR